MSFASLGIRFKPVAKKVRTLVVVAHSPPLEAEDVRPVVHHHCPQRNFDGNQHEPQLLVSIPSGVGALRTAYENKQKES